MGNTALVMAAYDGSTAIAKALIKAGANLDLHQSFSGATALTMAIWKGDPATVKALIKVGANLNLPNIVGRTPLIGAVIEGRTAIVKTLIKAGANLDLQTSGRCTALTLAIDKGHPTIVEALIMAGNLQDGDGKTALMWAIDKGMAAAAALMVERGATLAKGCTVRHHSSQWWFGCEEGGGVRVSWHVTAAQYCACLGILAPLVRAEDAFREGPVPARVCGMGWGLNSASLLLEA